MFLLTEEKYYEYCVCYDLECSKSLYSFRIKLDPSWRAENGNAQYVACVCACDIPWNSIMLIEKDVDTLQSLIIRIKTNIALINS